MRAPPDAAVVLVDALAAPPDPGLDRSIGAAAAGRLRHELRAIARRWAAEVAPGRVVEEASPHDAVAALAGHGGPVILLAPDVPLLGPVHAEAIASDLAGGAGLVVGSAHDARPYLVALPAVDGELLALVAGGFEALMAAANERGLELAMLRHERRLVTAADARALALDPLTPPALAAELDALRPGGHP